MRAARSRPARVHVAVKVRGGRHAAAVLRAAAQGWVSGGEELSIALVTDREMRRLLAHGILHCRGYDHASAADARRMAAAEQKLLGRTGMVGASLPRAE